MQQHEGKSQKQRRNACPVSLTHVRVGICPQKSTHAHRKLRVDTLHNLLQRTAFCMNFTVLPKQADGMCNLYASFITFEIERQFFKSLLFFLCYTTVFDSSQQMDMVFFQLGTGRAGGQRPIEVHANRLFQIRRSAAGKFSLFTCN